ncbi:MAG: NnrS family protein [Burkholderiaceae bacterium]
MNQRSASSIPVAGPAPAPALHGWPVFRLGFRPFYLGAALLACASVPLWVAVFLGHVSTAFALPALLWHGHEMVFGFAAGVVIGFLLTGVRAWTGLETPRGPLLAALTVLWLAARVAAVTGPYALFAVLDFALLPVVAVLLLRILVRAGNRRNIPLISLLLLLAVANAVFHLSVTGVLAVPAATPLYAGLALILMVVTVMAGRVVPVFTRNVTPGLKNSVPKPLEWGVLAATGLALALWVFGAPAGITGVLCALAAVLHAVRLALWKPQVTLTRPILWILHLAYAWLPIGFAVLAAAQAGWLAPSLAVHAFAVGTVGGLIIGMITRTARGHTGRPLKASWGETLAYALVLAAAVVRVGVPAAVPAVYAPALLLAAGLWGLAFLIYLLIYAPWLTQTRLDGKDG